MSAAKSTPKRTSRHCISQKGGKLCGAFALQDSKFCIMHDPRPEYVEKRAEMRSKAGKKTGGHNRRRIRFADPDEAPPAPTDNKSAVAYASWACRAVTTGRIDPRVADSICKLLKEFREGIARPDLEKRLAELEKRAEAARKREPWAS